ncbi:MAG: DEAD/DEAH box helicase family protein [Candidatus Nitrosopolaris sp.]
MAIDGSEDQRQRLLPVQADKAKIPAVGQATIKERNIVSVKAKKNRPQFIYNRVYLRMQPGKCLEYNLSTDTSLLTRDERFQEFMDRPYAVIPQGNHKGEGKAYLLLSPKWTDFRAGWLESQTETYNIFRVDTYAAWSGLVPDHLQEEFDLDPRYSSIKILQNGEYLVGNEFELEDVWIRYREYLLRKEKDIGIRIKSSASARFNVASKLVSDGVIPWTSRTVKESWKWLTDIKLRPYQQQAMDFFITHGAMTLVYPFGAGKTLFGIQVISCVSDKTLVVVPSVSHLAVWQKYIEEHLKNDNKNNTNERESRVVLLYGGSRKDAIKYADIIISTYESALTYLTNERFKLLIFDECHHFPASTYSRLAFLDADYRLGLSGSPYREDGRSELIYVLSGYPFGSDWDKLFEEGWVRKPEITVHVTSAKISFLQSLLQKLKGDTIVFCDSLAVGEEASRLTDVPFIYGEHSLKERVEALNKHKRLICSRIFDEGMHIPDVKNIIELDFLGGSRRQQLQRVGRLMHSLVDGVEYHLLMSSEELQKYERRLYRLYSKQFKVSVVKY